MEATAPTIRVRINHSSTVKDGWRHETTVEILTALPRSSYETDNLREDLISWVADADSVGREETNRRNKRDRPESFGVTGEHNE